MRLPESVSPRFDREAVAASGEAFGLSLGQAALCGAESPVGTLSHLGQSSLRAVAAFCSRCVGTLGPFERRPRRPRAVHLQRIAIAVVVQLLLLGGTCSVGFGVC